MLSKKIAIAAIAGTALLAASGAYARDDRFDRYRDHGRHSDYDHRYHGRHYNRHVPHREVVRQAPVYVMPAPVYYTPAPVYNAPARPVLSGQIPIGNNRNINIEFQL